MPAAPAEADRFVPFALPTVERSSFGTRNVSVRTFPQPRVGFRR